MARDDRIQLFENKRIRTAWDAEKEEWFFSIVDVVAVLTDQPDQRHAAKYWSVLKTRLKKEGSELTTKCSQLKMRSADGKRYNTDVADTEQLPHRKPNRSNSGWRRSAGNASRKPSIQS